MKIKMLKDARGSENGFSVKAFLSDQEYEVGEALGVAFVDEQKVAVRVGLAGVADKVEAGVDKVVEAVTGKKGGKKDDPAKD